MWAPVINNLLAIALFYFLLVSRGDLSVANISSQDLLWLGLGTTAGYLAQALILFPIVIKSGVKLSLRFDWANSQIIKSCVHGALWLLQRKSERVDAQGT